MDNYQYEEWARRFKDSEELTEVELYAKSAVTKHGYGCTTGKVLSMDEKEQWLKRSRLWMLTEDVINEQRKGAC